MKEGKGSYLVTLWWLLGCLCLGVLLLVLAPREERPSSTEKRMLAGAPELNAETLFSGAFFTGVEDYLSDGFFQRDRVIDFTDSLLTVFDMRTEEQRLIQEEAEIDRLLTEDAGWGEDASDDEEAEALSPAAEEPAITATQAPAATPEPTGTPTPEPTNTPTPEPTATPAPTATLEPTLLTTQTPIPTVATQVKAEPYATHTPAPTVTPKVIVPLDPSSSYALYLIRDEDTKDENYTYPAENIINFAASLNYLKDMLPADGEIHYMQVPVAAVGCRLSIARSKFIGWESTMEDALQSQVRENIFIHNVPAILNDHLVAKETDLYYFTDHHWSPKGAWYALEAVMKARGMPVVPYDEYAYQRKLMGRDESGIQDWIEALYPLMPVRSVVLRELTKEKESVLMDYRSSDYITYLGGTETPWRRLDSGYGTDRKALVICDSFGNAFVPYLLPYYDEVHMTDLRRGYYKVSEAGGTFAELVAHHQIDDIYIVLSTSNGINSSNSQKTFWQTISR